MPTRKKLQVESVAGSEVDKSEHWKNQEPEAAEVAAIAEPEPEPVDPITAKAEQIKSFFGLFDSVEGVEFDTENPDHQIIAAFLVGSNGMIRR